MRTLAKIIFIVAMSVMLLTGGSALTSAQAGARVYLQPMASSDGRLIIEVMAANVTQMYGAEVQLTYDPAVVSVQDARPDQEGIQIQAGNLLPADQGFVIANQVNPVEGTIIFALTLLNPAPPVTGSGPLARVTFNVLTQAPSTINIEKAKLVSIDLQTIPSQITPLAIGQVESQSAIPQQPVAAVLPPESPALDVANSSDFPWWIVAAGIMILGLLSLGTLVVMSGLDKSSLQSNQPHQARAQPQPLRQSQALSQTAPQRVDQQRPKHVAGTRPSAFK